MNGDRCKPLLMRDVLDLETDSTILDRRQKNITYGKNTEGYQNYLKMIPKAQRKPGHPRTPVKNIRRSRRAWDGEVRTWRLLLHAYDPPKSEPVNATVSGTHYSTVTDQMMHKDEQDQNQDQLEISIHQKYINQLIKDNEERIESNDKRIKRNEMIIKEILCKLKNNGSQTELENLDSQNSNTKICSAREITDDNNNSSATAMDAGGSLVSNEAMDMDTTD